MALTGKQQIFIDEYLKTYNATQAALVAGYSEKTAYSQGWENLRKPEIAEIIGQRITESAMGANEVLARLASFARGSLKPFLVQRPDDDQVTLDLTTSLAQDNIHLIKKITQKRTIRTGRDDEEIDEITMSIELIDPKSALDTLAKHHGLLVDRTELTGKDGTPLPASIVTIYMPDNGRNDRN